jgi:predicted DNA-binding protein
MATKTTKHAHILFTPELKKKLELFSYYSGKSISEIVRLAVERLDAKEFPKQ